MIDFKFQFLRHLGVCKLSMSFQNEETPIQNTCSFSVFLNIIQELKLGTITGREF